MRSARRTIALAAMAIVLSGCGRSTPAVPTATCDQIERFARQLVNVGITYDYDPSLGPADLAEWADVVVRGWLTGAVRGTSELGVPGDTMVGWEVAVNEVLSGTLPAGQDTIVVGVDYNPHHTSLAAFAAATSPGIPVIVFGRGRPDAEPDGPFTAALEGFLTACEGAAPIGRVGTEGDWPTMTSLEDVAAAVRTG